MTDDCIFCKIINGDAPCHKIYEDAKTLAFLSIANDYYGHTLVVPKSHCESILDCPPNTLIAVMNTVKKLGNHFVKDLGFDGVNVFINNGAAAEQVVFHLHVHLAPRRKGVPHIWGQLDRIKRDLEKERKELEIR